MLIRSSRSYLAPYRGPLTVVVALQFIGTVVALYLPSLNADIIDKGVVTGDTGYIVRIGAVMLGVALRPDRLLGRRRLVRRAYGDGLRPRRARGDLPPRRHRSRQREVQDFGAPSLITRETNDVQQVQMLVLMSCTLMVMAPIMMVGGIVMAMREDLGLSWLIAVTVPVLAVALGLIIIADGAELPADAGPHRRGQPAAARADHRRPRGPRLRPRAARDRALRRRPTRDLTDGRHPGRPLAGRDVPDRDAGRERRVGRRCCGSAATGSSPAQMQVGALTAYLSYLMQIVMSVMMGTFMMMMIPRSAVCADRIMEVLDTDTSVPPPAEPVADLPERGTLRARRRRVQLPRRRRAGAPRPHLPRPSPARPSPSSARPAPARARWSTWCRGSSTSPAARSRSTASTYAGSSPSGSGRVIGLVPQKAYLFSGTVAVQPAARQAGRHRRRALGGAARSPRPRDFVARDARGARRPDRPGRHQRQRRPAAAPRDRPRRGTTTRRSTCSTTRSRRSTWPPTPGCGRRCAR